MFTPGLVLFGAYALTQWFLELHSHANRSLRGRERVTRPLATFAWIALAGMAVFFDYNDTTVMIFGVLAAVAVATAVADNSMGARGRRSAEYFGRSVHLMLTPLVLGALMAFWRFIDGAGFFLGMVMPMSTANLRPLCTGYLIATGLLFVYQVRSVRRAKSRRAVAPATDTTITVNKLTVETAAMAETRPGQVTATDIAKRAS